MQPTDWTVCFSQNPGNPTNLTCRTIWWILSDTFPKVILSEIQLNYLWFIQVWCFELQNNISKQCSGADFGLSNGLCRVIEVKTKFLSRSWEYLFLCSFGNHLNSIRSKNKFTIFSQLQLSVRMNMKKTNPLLF